MAASMRLLGLSRQGKFAASNVFNCIAQAGGIQGTARHLATYDRLNIQPEINLRIPFRAFSSATAHQSDDISGKVDKHEFKAETRKLLEIVANSLYSENEVFIRELVSNASDALEKFRYVVHTAGENEKQYQSTDRSLNISMETKKHDQQLIIHDNGIGMTREELINNLGTIARSGSKQFLKECQDAGNSEASNIIGQFGVGFYSAFMVANRIEVVTKSSKVDSVGLKWTSDGTGSFEIEEVDGVDVGTTIILHLKQDCREYADEERIKAVIKKYSNFVGFPVTLNGNQINELQPLWLMDPKTVTNDQYNEFFRYITNTGSKPAYTIHYKADVPVSIRALLYIPENAPNFLELSGQSEGGISLYTRKVLIQSGLGKFLPGWLRFVKGVVDSEDIPLNLSRELLQNSALINKISRVLTTRVVRHLDECAKKDPLSYQEFYMKYSSFIYEGMVTTNDNSDLQATAKLLRYTSSNGDAFTGITSLEDYCKRAPETQKSIYYLVAPNRESALASPHYENLAAQGTEVILCLHPNDEMIFQYLRTFAGKEIEPAEKALRSDVSDTSATDFGEDSLPRSQINELTEWVKAKLEGKVSDVVPTSRLGEHPCVVTVENMAQVRNLMQRGGSQVPTENLLAILRPRLEVNPAHPIIKKLFELKTSNPELGDLLVEQLFVNAIVGARFVENTQILFKPLNKLLTKMLEKY